MSEGSTEAILVGLITQRPAVGEGNDVETVGSIMTDDLEDSRLIVDVLYDAAVVNGLNPPPQLVFLAGEI